jgi:membrane protein implicated in regulation of membrane protease activity
LKHCDNLSLHSQRTLCALESKMEWSAATLWWVAAGLLVTAELFAGSFYMLMLALGCAAGALAASTGMGMTAQVFTAALVGAGTTAVWHFKRARSPRSAPVESNRDANLDIGESLQVPAWNGEGVARVSYRGSAWNVVFRGPGAPAPGEHVIVAVQGNRLIVSPASH